MPRAVPPYFRVDYDVADVSALQEMAAGKADPDTAKRAMELIINQIASTYQVTFQPGDPHSSAFAEGRRFVGLKIVEMLTVSTRDLMLREQKKKQEPANARPERTPR